MEHSLAQLCIGDIPLWSIWRLLVWGRLLPVSEIFVASITIYVINWLTMSRMIVFFAYLGVVCKTRIPQAHTVLEIVRIRYGTCKWLLSMMINILIAVNRYYCTPYFHFLGNREQSFQHDQHDLRRCSCDYLSVRFAHSNFQRKVSTNLR